MNELANKEVIMLFTLLGATLILIGGTLVVGAADMLVFWIRRAGPGSAWLLTALSGVLVVTGLVDPTYRELVMAAALVATLVQAMIFWWVTVAWQAAADQLDLKVRRDMSGTLALSVAATAVFVGASVYAGLWAQ